jgi:glycosyltransferase involved in cell wall biosynthesis
MIAATVLIPARDAETTIQRAVRSAASQGAARVVLIDDWSSDSTVSLARAALPALDVVRPVEHRTLGFARQAGLSSVTTDFLVWLDADDELLDGRAARLVEALDESGGDFASDSVELMDGVTGKARGILRVPGFLTRDPSLSRLFERNYLPAPGAVVARTASALRVGYDSALHGAEDIDHLLRAIAAGAHWSLHGEPGYRQWAYPASQSRDLRNQRKMTAAALRKHAFEDVEQCLRGGGWSEPVVDWAIVSLALFREEWTAALARLDRLASCTTDRAAILEGDGPCPLCEGWRLDFHLGTVHALGGQPAVAREHLRRAFETNPTAETANNLGAVLAMCGDRDSARRYFARALEMFAGYADARANLEDPASARLTSHPLRRDRWREDYGGEG